LAILGFAGVTPIDTSIAGVTVNTVDALVPLKVAKIVTEPGVRAVPRPSYPDALLTVVTVGSEELHMTCAVRTCVELSV
jgi:hypothetical protein